MTAAREQINLDRLVDYRAEYTAVIRNCKISGDNLIGLCPFHEDSKGTYKNRAQTP